MITPVKLPKESKDDLIVRVQQFFEQERSETIGNLAAEHLVDFMIRALGPHIYNKAVGDARHMLLQKFAALEDELYALELPIRK